MKRILLIVFVLISVCSFGQYTRINHSYDWLGGYFRGRLYMPAGIYPASGTGDLGVSGRIHLDTLHRRYYYKDSRGFIALVDTTMSSFLATRRFGFTGEDTRATAARTFSAANQVFTIDSMGHGSRIVQKSRALIQNNMSFVNRDGTDSSFVTVSGVSGGSKTLQVGVSNISIANASNLGSYLKIFSGGTGSSALNASIYTATGLGNISDFYQDSTTTYIRSYNGNTNSWSNISLFHDSSTWWQGLHRTSVINLFDRAADQFAQDRLAWRTTDSTGKIIIEKGLVEIYAGTNEITLADPTGITIEPYKNNLFIDSLNNSTSAVNKMLIRDSSTGKVQEKYMVRNLTTNTTDVGNVGAGEDDLMTYSVPGGTMANDGDYIEFVMAFSVAANSTLKVKYGGTQLFSQAVTNTDAVYRVTGQIIRTSATTQDATFHLSGGATINITGYQTPAETLSGAVTLKATGEGTSNDDIIQKIMIVKYFPGL